MDATTIQKLLYRGESEILDFKSEQYRFEKASDEEKSGLLKDIMAFANAWRDSEAYILIGVEEVRGGHSIIRGINKHLADHELQQFINSKVQRPIKFSYEGISINGLQVGVISIPLQNRPFFAKNKFGNVEAGRVYLRRGSSTDIATPDEIAEMGKKTNQTNAAFEIKTNISLGPLIGFPDVLLNTWLFNDGNATAYDVQVTAKSEHRGNLNFNHTMWKEKAVPHPERAQSSLQPLHPGDRQHIFTWALGYIQPNNEQVVAIGYGKKVSFEKPVNYMGDDVIIELKIFARDLFPTTITIGYTKEEIKNLTQKAFRPS
jgi:hypothetical protein